MSLLNCEMNVIISDWIGDNHVEFSPTHLSIRSNLDDGMEAGILLLNSSKLVYRSPYRVSNYERQVLREIVQELKGQGVIRDSCSDYSSPVLLVSKKTGDKRMVIDYRHLNSQTIKDKYPLPCTDFIERFSGFSLFFILDACQGFSQIPMDEESSRKAAFTTPDGHYEPIRLFFGLSNGPPVCQRAMSLSLGYLL
ncbi:Retrovirus-related Pol polyprotein like [Argiope bruennichi]|uniref:Retrovirus-related Pol polyprotein like n=1 Tax=Argiope bruennichi TaxID=94029 RepID=A0A8T0EAQ9_ARGBR|nr:Retrovirus-related Pol polyprotein like [Argiope bruennichi]